MRCALLYPAFNANLPTGNCRLTLSPAMVSCWTISIEGTSAAQESDSSGGADTSPSFPSLVERPYSLFSAESHSIPITKHGTPRRCRTGMLKTSQRPRKNSIGLHSQNVQDSQSNRNVVLNGLAISGSAKLEEPSTWLD